jgi:acyl carrier protein
MLTRDEIAARVREFILLNFVMADESLTEHDSLVETGILDSTGLLELVLFLEEAFAIAIPQEDLVPEQLETIARITDYVAARLAPSQAPVA